MWPLLFLLSFLINIVLILYFLTPFRKTLDVARKEDDLPPIGYYDETRGPVLLKEADSSDYSSVFDDKGWRNLIGTEPYDTLSNVSERED
jgi:hypothetical protein